MSNENTQRPLISIVVPTYNRAEWVGGAIESLLSQATHDAFDFEVIIVDNASKDHTKTEVEHALANASVPAHYVYSEKPGDAPTRNAGVRKAKGQWIAFFDDDQFATEDWLWELLQAAKESGGRIVGGPVHLDLSKEQLESLGRLGRMTLREIDFYPTLQTYRGNDLPGTGNVLVDRRLFDEVGMFDESMTMGGSDFNFFLSARERGHELWYSPKAVIRHRIEPNRLTAAYHRWESMSGAAHHALLDGTERGKLVMVGIGIARLGQWSFVTLPNMAWAWATGNSGEVFSRRIQAWRTFGYLRGVLKSLSPRRFPQTVFFDSLDFRKGREVGMDEVEETPENGGTEKAGAADAAERLLSDTSR